MNGLTVDPIILHLALRRIARRESALRRRRSGLWHWLCARVFTPRHSREHLARLGPAETVHNNLSS